MVTTGRNYSEEELNELRTKLRKALHITPQPVYVIPTNFVLTNVNYIFVSNGH